MEDIIRVILSYASAHDYKSALLVNKQWNFALQSESLWKYLFLRNFYNTSLPKDFQSWRLFYIHVHNQYMSCLRQPRYHFVSTPQYKNDDFWNDPESGIKDIDKLILHPQVGDIVVVESLSGCTEGNLTSFEIIDEDIVGFFVYDNDLYLQSLSFDYIDECMGAYAIKDYPLYYWSFYLGMDYWSLSEHDFLLEFDLDKNSTIVNGKSRTWFIHNYVKYELFADRIIEDWADDISDYDRISVGQDDNGDYPSKYRTLYLTSGEIEVHENEDRAIQDLERYLQQFA